jgi:hypothetical protein
MALLTRKAQRVAIPMRVGVSVTAVPVRMGARVGVGDRDVAMPMRVGVPVTAIWSYR